MNHCRECKHWRPHGERSPGYQYNDLLPEGACNRPNLDGGLFSASNDDGGADVITEPDFGCIQFEAKE